MCLSFVILIDLKNADKLYNIIGRSLETKIIDCEVRQGTVLEPLILNLYINYLFTLNSSGIYLGYADDTAVWEIT